MNLNIELIIGIIAYLSVSKLIYEHFMSVSFLLSRAKLGHAQETTSIISCIQCPTVTLMINIIISIYNELLV